MATKEAPVEKAVEPVIITLSDVQASLGLFKATVVNSNIAFRSQIEGRIQDIEAYLLQQ
jgi:hypothetical protein